jgi:hypothetical protein
MKSFLLHWRIKDALPETEAQMAGQIVRSAMRFAQRRPRRAVVKLRNRIADRHKFFCFATAA